MCESNKTILLFPMTFQEHEKLCYQPNGQYVDCVIIAFDIRLLYRPTVSTLTSGKTLTNTYDSLGRLTQKRWSLSSNYDTSISYISNADGTQTALVASWKNGSDTPYTYQYDANGNITQIVQGNVSVTYAYDSANQLIRENNGFTNQTVTYEYDSWGNILNKKTYAYTTGDLTTPTSTDTYTYGNESWGDQLTEYNGQTIAYDEMGNPTTYLGYTMGWQGKQLISANNGTNNITYTYNEDGLRLTKTVNGTTTNYYYNGSVLISMTTGSTTQQFHYDASGSAIAVTYNGTEYYYIRNAQGDIVKLIDASGNAVVEYTYDSWGKLLSTTGSLSTTLGDDQPFRYRGYTYDTETSLYYLQTRYYDPTTCRFISSDVVLSTGQGVIGHNAYAYCLNNPVNMFDSQGSIATATVIIIVCVVIGMITSGAANALSQLIDISQKKSEGKDANFNLPSFFASVGIGGIEALLCVLFPTWTPLISAVASAADAVVTDILTADLDEEKWETGVQIFVDAFWAAGIGAVMGAGSNNLLSDKSIRAVEKVLNKGTRSGLKMFFKELGQSLFEDFALFWPEWLADQQFGNLFKTGIGNCME